MFKKFTQKKELDKVNQAFKQGGAYLTYILITCMERNVEYFEDHFTLREKITTMLDKGLEFSEKGNERVAYIHFREGLEYISKEYPELIDNDEDLLDTVSQAMDYEKAEINPTWLAYKEKYKV